MGGALSINDFVPTIHITGQVNQIKKEMLSYFQESE